jgi:glycosyltransferase involved in cell wall biosynthesis
MRCITPNESSLTGGEAMRRHANAAEREESVNAQSAIERALLAEISALKTRIEEAEDIAAAGIKWQQQAIALDERVRAIRSSTSWKITRPIRAAKDLFRRASNLARRRKLPAELLIHRVAQYARLATVTPVPSAIISQADLDTLSFTIIGHASGSYSLASVNRRIVKCLDTHLHGRVRLLPVENDVRGQIADVDEPERAYLLAISHRKPKLNSRSVAIVQHYPLYVPEAQFDLKLLMIFWEESLIPESYVDTINSSFDGVLAPTRAVRKILIDSGVFIPVRVVDFPADLSAFREIATSRRDTTSGVPKAEVTFLHVSSCFPRKGVDVLLSAYAKVFRTEDPVRLVIKGFPNPHNNVAEQIARLRKSDPHAPAITFVNEDLDHTSMLRLYEQADAVVLPTRGEGLNLPAAEAIAAGLPLIVTGFGGHLDFCDQRSARLIDYSFGQARTHLSRQNSVWVEPDDKDLSTALRETYECILASRPKRVVEDNWPLVAPYFDESEWAKRVQRVSFDLLTSPRRQSMRIAWISTFGIRCGIAEYSKHLLKELISHNRNVVVMCDRRTNVATVEADFRVVPAWAPGDPESMESLASEIAAEDPDLVVIQHQPGLISLKALSYLLEDRRIKYRKLLITLHNVKDVIDVTPDPMSDVHKIFSKFERVLVHTVRDLNLLKSIGLVKNVTLFPHGVALVHFPENVGAPQHQPAEPLIGCYGFFLPNKGIGPLIASLGILKRIWPGARLRLVNAEYSLPISATEIQRCRNLAAQLQVQDNIEWITDFLPHERSVQLLSECDLVVLPYQETNEASSASGRGALSSGRAVAVTPLRIFEDLGSAVYRLPGTDTRSIADGIAALLRSPELQSSTISSATAWLFAHDWKLLAKRLHGMLLGIVNSSSEDSELRRR